MSINYSDSRRTAILELLLDSEYVSMPYLEKELNLSKRSIYYEICKVNEWLESCGLNELMKERGKGYFLDEDTKQKVEAVLHERSDNSQNRYILSPKERIRIIICYIIYTDKPVYINELMDCCDVSRNTIFNDLGLVRNLLEEYDLELCYQSRTGYKVEGDVIRIRALFFYEFSRILGLFQSGVIDFIPYSSIKDYLENFKKIETELNVYYVQGTVFALAALIPIMEKNEKKLYFPDLKREEIKRTKEYHLILKYFPQLCENESIYLCLHLLGSRISVASDDLFYVRSNETVYELSKAILVEFEKTACVIFDSREELEKALFLHISASLYRYKYGIQIGNPMEEEIIKKYPELFEITKITCKYIEKQFNVPVLDGEVAYLALHFGAYLKTSESIDEHLKILIVCASGISAGNMIRREIEELLPGAEVVGVAAATELVNVQSICDIVISTLRLKCLVPVVVVHPILTDMDKNNILSHPLVKKHHNSVDGDQVFEIVKKYVKKEDYNNLKAELNSFFNQGKKAGGVLPVRERPGLLELLDVSKIKVFEQNYTWERAVLEVGKCLVDNGSILSSYLDTIISNTLRYGTYMFITQDVVLAHAKPEEGVKRLDISIGIFKQSIRFSDFYKAKIIIVLAADGQRTHLKVLKQIMDIFFIPARVELLEQKDSPENVIQTLKEILE